MSFDELQVAINFLLSVGVVLNAVGILLLRRRILNHESEGDER